MTGGESSVGFEGGSVLPGAPGVATATGVEPGRGVDIGSGVEPGRGVAPTAGSDGIGAHGCAGAHGGTGGAGLPRKMRTAAISATAIRPPTKMATIRPEPVLVGPGEGAHEGRP